MNQKNIQILYITCRDKAEALTIGKVLVEERLAACANIMDGMTSVYFWQGKLQEEQEVVLLLKTTVDQAEACATRVRALHSYEVPCVMTWTSAVLNSDYFSWVENNVK